MRKKQWFEFTRLSKVLLLLCVVLFIVSSVLRVMEPVNIPFLNWIIIPSACILTFLLLLLAQNNPGD